MGRKGKRTAGMEEVHPFTGMSQVNPNAGGVDIGAVDLQAIGKWLKEYQVKTVAMESTGVYWMVHLDPGPQCQELR